MDAAPDPPGAAAPGDERVQQLQALLHVDEQQARWWLDAAGGSFEGAVQMWSDSHPGADGAQPAPHAGAIPARPAAPLAAAAAGAPPAPAAAAAAAAAAPRRRRRGGGGGLFGLPFKLLSTGIGVVASVVQLALSVAAYVGDRVLPASVMRGARGVARSLLDATAEPPDPAAQATQFIAAFDAAYPGLPHPAWVATSWRQAATTAHQQFKFLFVYLHSPEHDDTDAYVRSVLCSDEVASYVNAQFVSWGGDVRRPDAFALAGRLNVATYPCVALLAFSGARTKLVAAAQGAVRAPQLLLALRRAVEEQGLLLTAERLEQEEREMSRRLLEEQNAEYEASLAADRERERQRQEARRQAEEEERARAVEEARVRAEAEAAEQRRLQAAASLAARRAQKAAALPQEPPPGAPGTAAIRVRLPDGQNHQRRFEPSSRVAQLYDWVDSLEGFDCLRYSLVCAFPKRVLDAAGCGGLSLEDAGLVPQGALFVQVLDDGDA